MTGKDLRQKFLKFFEKNSHKIIPSSSLIPENDPSVLLTTAGMQQFKPYFAGEKNAVADFDAENLTSVQKCFRTSDIDEVGDYSHNTFFEMLGNFSIGGYFKEKSIELMWEFATKEIGLEQEKLSATYFEGDNKTPKDIEARDAWIRYLPANRVNPAPRADTFWGPTGDEGPCGTSSEFFYEIEKEKKLEIWTLVFMTYFCTKDGNYQSLNQTGVDTGGGLERLALVMQGKSSIFETDLFLPIIKKIEILSGTEYGRDKGTDRKIRIIADHARAITFLISDGVTTSNKDRGYILRRIIRRSLTHAKLLKDNFNNLEDLIKVVIDEYKEIYSKLKELDLAILQEEQTKFRSTLKAGLKKYQGFGKKISGEEAFLLFTSFGFPIELTQDLAKEDGKKVDRTEFDKEMQKHQTLSRSS